MPSCFASSKKPELGLVIAMLVDDQRRQHATTSCTFHGATDVLFGIDASFLQMRTKPSV